MTADQTKTPIRVLFIKTGLDAAELDLIRQLHNHGVFIKVICWASGTSLDFLEKEEILINPVRKKGKFDVPFICQIRSVVKQFDINLIHATDSTALANAIWATYFTNVKIIAYRGTSARIRKTDPTYWLGALHPKVSLTFCVSKSVYQYMKTRLPEHKLRLNYKGFDPSWINVESPQPADFPKLPEDRFIGIFLGSSAGRPHKGLEILIKAFHQLNDTKNILIVLGNSSPEAERLASEGPAHQRIFLIGRVKNATDWLCHADLYIQPSLGREGLPRSVKEAMAAALPIIITDIPGPTELIEHEKSGLVIEAGNADALTQAWERMASDAHLRQRLGVNAKTRLIEKFSPEAFFQNTLMAYHDVLHIDPNA
ncbi:MULTISPECIES: glycosyltransferase family 4 protein [unclassified Marinobacter]|uniref:glycosyltransferase family 4 protein n=1 Tax=unclassified Marinobacter TaxID=83889 RepID=UPI0026E38099|nr:MULTISPECIES: glycosyltransferase family 4 protein [unclassified Marinobacter]MDO6443881.1 glycosyltransferase family 4 protein [Marinobacter sp. 2_MG-2023]MDO6825230.1 glycosyltransferase family 4 protein [Marinobacter sp. 1_MG-2023]